MSKETIDEERLRGQELERKFWEERHKALELQKAWEEKQKGWREEEDGKRKAEKEERKREEMQEEEECKREETKEMEVESRNEMKAGVSLLVAVITVIIAVALIGTCAILMMVGPAFDYNTAVHSHMENAYYAADPVTMKAELLEAKQGMIDLGLTDDMYSRYWSWEKTPDWSMKWQYTHMDSVVLRCDEFIAWIEAQNQTGSQQMQDVYSQKLDNVRAFIKNDGGWSDDIAQGAYYLMVCPFYYVEVWFVFVTLVTVTLASSLMGMYYSHGL